jgi:hypothetical protein
MRTTIALGFFAMAFLSFAPAAIAAPADVFHRTTQAAPLAMPVPKFQMAACRFWQCNCHRECVIYEGSKCVQSVQTCDTCSKCDD